MLCYVKGVDECDMDLYCLCFVDDVEVFDFLLELIKGVDVWWDYVIGVLE